MCYYQAITVRVAALCPARRITQIDEFIHQRQIPWHISLIEMDTHHMYLARSRAAQVGTQLKPNRRMKARQVGACGLAMIDERLIHYHAATIIGAGFTLP
jgi:hypothetical protein